MQKQKKQDILQIATAAVHKTRLYRKEVRMKHLIEDLDELIAASPVLFIEIGDISCGPCLAIGHRIDAWTEKHPEVTARYIPIKKQAELCAGHGILSAPAVLVYIKGQLMIKKSGYFSLEEVFDKTERYLLLADLEIREEAADEKKED